MADFVERRAEMVADAVVYEFVGAPKEEDIEEDDDNKASRELSVRQSLGSIVTTGFWNDDDCEACEVLDHSCLDVVMLDYDGERAVAVASCPGVRLRLKGSYATRDTQTAMQVGSTEPSDGWPCTLQVLIAWTTMVKLLKLTKDNELMLRVDQMDGVVDASKVAVGGGYPVRERLNKLQMRSGCVTGSTRTKSDLFFILPDCIPSASSVSSEPLDTREIAKQLEAHWKAGKAIAGDLELRQLAEAARQSPVECADLFCALAPAAQRATAQRLLLEAKQAPHDVIICPAFRLVERALIGKVSQKCMCSHTYICCEATLSVLPPSPSR